MTEFVGTANADVFSGTADYDTAYGKAGNDRLRGNGGNDVLVGDEGADTLEGGDGYDTLFSGAHYGYWDESYPPLLDRGTELDILRGGAQSDIISAGYGDTIAGGADYDQLLISFMGASSGISVDFLLAVDDGMVTVGGANIASIESVRWVEGTDFNDVIETNGGALFGMGGDDYLVARYSSVVSGGDGNDTIDATLAAKNYYEITGDAGDDTIFGLSGGHKALGGEGNDRFSGAGIMEGGAGNDVFDLAYNHEWQKNTAVLAGDGDDLIDGSDSGSNDTLIGNGGADNILGGDGDDRLYSGGMAVPYQLQYFPGIYMSPQPDSLEFALTFDNGAERDEVFGGGGNDFISVGYGDVADGGSGTNRLVLTLGGASAGVTLATDDLIAPGGLTLGGAAINNFQAVAMISGSDHGDTLTLGVQDASTYAYGGAGNDTIVSTDSDWTVNGDAGDDRLTGSAGNDTIDGGDGNDWIEGGDGNDDLIAGTGADRLEGGAGDDRLFLDDFGAGDVIVGGSGVDTLWVRHADDLSLAAISGVERLADYDGASVFMTVEQFHGFSMIETYGVILTTGDAVTVRIATDALINLSNAGNTITFDDVGRRGVVYGRDGNDTITGTAYKDFFHGGGGDDRFRATAGGDVLYGGEGSDTLDYRERTSAITVTLGTASGGTTGTTSAGEELHEIENVDGTAFGDTLTGGWTNNVLLGFGGNDTLKGMAGHDLLDGGAGADTMNGGTGDDRFVVDDIGDKVVELANEGNDSVDASITYSLGLHVEALRLTGSAAIDGTGNQLANRIIGNNAANRIDGAAGADAMEGGAGDDLYIVDNSNDRVIENEGEGTDRVEASASFSVAGQHVEILTLTGTAAINGTGNALANTLIGNSAANRIDGGAGADTLIGGAGNDTYIVEEFSDVVVELRDGGFDTVESSASHYRLSAHIEKLVLTGTAAINGYGNDSNNVVVGNAGANVIDGEAGADLMSGGAGDDRYIVERIGDIASEAAGEGNDLVESTISYALASGSEVETLRLIGPQAIRGTGNEFANTIFGSAANNVLNGGAGADTLHGSLGDDRYIVDNAGDKVIEIDGYGIDVVESSVSFSLSGQFIEKLTLTGTAAINGTGNGLANLLTGNNQANILNGGGGADEMAGRKGDDTYFVDNAGDKVVELDGEGSDIVNASVSYSLAGQFAEVLNLVGSAVNGTGNGLNNRIVGNSLANSLNGGTGNDRLDGGTGADTMVGGLGNDVFVVDNVADKVGEKVDEGSDTVEASISYSLAGQYVEMLKLTGAANIDATGNNQANSLGGNSGANRLNGMGGADSMAGGAGNDSYVVDDIGDKVLELLNEGVDSVAASVTFSLAGQYAENLTLTGSAAINGTGNGLANALAGNAAANTLSGGGGDDVLNGSLGHDRLNGGAGMDAFLFDSALGTNNVDAILDFEAADDTVRLDSSEFGALTPGELAASAFAAGTAAVDADDRIVFDNASGNLWYDADGNGAGAAVLFANAGVGVALSAADFLIVA